MCAAKSPISLLQEFTVMKHMPFPQYNLTQHGSGFKCVANVGSISTSAIAESKKRAKHLCAEGMLKIIQHHAHNHSNLTIIINQNVEKGTIVHGEVHNNPILQLDQVHINSQEPQFNAIGKLNELCSQNGQMYPNYEELGVVEQKFVIQCRLLSHTTQGQASTKKQAKQIAAKEMLNSFKLPDLLTSNVNNNNVESKEKPARNAEMEIKMINLFRTLSAKVIKKSEMHDSYCQSQNNMFPVPQKEKSKTEIPQKAEKPQPEISEEELKEELQMLGVTYKIVVLQKYPLVLALTTLKTATRPVYTFMHYAETYKIAVIGLLNKAVHDISFLDN